MSLVGQGTADVDTNETTILDYPDGGVFVAYLNCFSLQAGQNMEIRAYSRANKDSDLQIYTSTVVGGAAPVDPSIFELGPIVGSQVFELTAELTSGVASIPWRVESVGRVTTVPDGEGSQLAVVSTEHDLITVPFGGTFMLLVDVSEMLAGDTTKLRLKARTEDSGEIRTTKYAAPAGEQANGIYALGPIVVHDTVIATLQQTAGVARTYEWQIVRLA